MERVLQSVVATTFAVGLGSTGWLGPRTDAGGVWTRHPFVSYRLGKGCQPDINYTRRVPFQLRHSSL